MSEQPIPARKPPAERRHLLLAAAEQVFLAQGYHAATMNDVARAAGMSKKTLYELVSSKEELFAALIAWRQSQIELPPDDPAMPPVERITLNLLAVARFLLAPPQVGLLRLIITEHTSSPDFSRDILRRRLAKARRQLEAACLTLPLSRGIPRAEAKELTAMLFGMVIGDSHLSALAGFRAAPAKAALEARARRAVTIFISGCCASDGGLTPLSPTWPAPPPDV